MNASEDEKRLGALAGDDSLGEGAAFGVIFMGEREGGNGEWWTVLIVVLY